VRYYRDSPAKTTATEEQKKRKPLAVSYYRPVYVCSAHSSDIVPLRMFLIRLLLIFMAGPPATYTGQEQAIPAPLLPANLIMLMF
jgi:hypothetical protein